MVFNPHVPAAHDWSPRTRREALLFLLTIVFLAIVSYKCNTFLSADLIPINNIYISYKCNTFLRFQKKNLTIPCNNFVRFQKKILQFLAIISYNCFSWNIFLLPARPRVSAAHHHGPGDGYTVDPHTQRPGHRAIQPANPKP
jgi:hypothetical protein